MRHSVFYPLVYGYLMGIYVVSLFSDSISFYCCVGIFCITAALLVYTIFSNTIYIHREPLTYSSFFIFLIMMLSACGGGFRYVEFTQFHGDTSLFHFVDTTITAEGVVVEEPDMRETETLLTVELRSITVSPQSQVVTLRPTKIVVFDTTSSHCVYGDDIHVAGILEVPENFTGDTGREFDYQKFLQKDSIFYTLTHPSITVIKHHQGNILKEKLLLLKNGFISNLTDAIGAPESRLAAGLIVAGKRALPQTIQNDFAQSGTLQVVVLSGYNVTIIAESIALVFSFLPVLFSSFISILLIIGFTIMAGGSATIVRGSMMAIIVILGTLLRRKYTVLRALLVTAFIMLLVNPMLLVFDPSFQLSFLATLGLIIFSPYIECYLMWMPEFFNIRKVCAASVAAYISVLPFLLWSSGTLSIVALPANFSISLLIPSTMLVCFITGCLCYVSLLLALPIAWFSYALLSIELALVHFYASLPFATIALPYFPTWCMIVIYLCYGVVLYRLKIMKQKTHLP